MKNYHLSRTLLPIHGHENQQLTTSFLYKGKIILPRVTAFNREFYPQKGVQK